MKGEGRLARESSTLLGIDQVKTTSHHPQTIGILERLHGTLESMLTKAKLKGLDWVDQVLLALVALRQCPSTSTGSSPSELVYGHKTASHLNFIYSRRQNKVPTADLKSRFIVA